MRDCSAWKNTTNFVTKLINSKIEQFFCTRTNKKHKNLNSEIDRYIKQNGRYKILQSKYVSITLGTFIYIFFLQFYTKKARKIDEKFRI